LTTKSNSPAAYNDCKFVMDLALEKPGLRYECKSAGAAMNFKQRCNKYRNLLRDQATELVAHIPGQRGSTIYDLLVIKQVNPTGGNLREGTVLVFEHQVPEGRIIDPETGEEILPPRGSLLDG